MITHLPNTVARHTAVLWLVVIAAGCNKPSPTEKYVPSPQAAQQAVDAILKAWQAGDEPGLISDVKPQVHLTDAHRKPGQKLVKYQILGEVPGDAGRCIAVKATFSQPASEERIRFVVLGIDPLWVFRHEDFELLMHWEHKMDPVPAEEEKQAKAKDQST